ncbi:hypothetical protein [Roseibium suaedae]|uniref:Uncharacterized protein n=1 Tax=Roseibium suaedae TaxID=735517 RepID=A0A1M7LC13_9HYPH|nr:hypothetical protein [Roseibium suaedae]SHM75506.1 hypothetical protein SAMN05444272_3153 [Roseibium suaedae]
MRSIAAAARAAERDAQRRHKQEQKEQMIADSGTAVEQWEQYIDDLVSIHTDMVDMIDWSAMRNLPAPIQPVKRNDNQVRAEEKLSGFKPSIFHIFRGGSRKIHSELQDAVTEASQKDDQIFQTLINKYHADYAEWVDDTELAKKLLNGEVTAIRQVIEEMQSLTSKALIGSGIDFSIGENVVHAQPQVHSDEIIPSFRRKQLSSGRLSETKMPVGQFNELYQDYVASVALKTAGDLFHILPLQEIYVTCMANTLNSETGHKDWSPIISVHFVRETFLKLNLSKIDPSDSLRNFGTICNSQRQKAFLLFYL